ncbi:MAG: methyltransferase domain-containing protein [Candidatus Omnitrophica bacterium]|nr:methyltransferase domain-containing protein [Candidatus Omnitrophota bacterium]
MRYCENTSASIKQRLKLNIGCGLIAPSGWVNIDSSFNAKLAKWPGLRKMLAALHIMPLAKAEIPYPRNIYVHDIRRGLPFPDNSAEVIHCQFFLEHLSKQDAQSFMKECYRVLSPQGVIRVTVPDLVQYAELYIKGIGQINRGTLMNEQLPAERFLEDLGLFEKESAATNILIQLYKKIYNKNIHKWMYDEYSLTSLLKEHGFSNIQRKQPYESLIKDIEKVDYDKFYNAICLEAQKP